MRLRKLAICRLRTPSEGAQRVARGGTSRWTLGDARVYRPQMVRPGVSAGPFVGRTDELTAIRGSLAAALDGAGPRAAFVFGRPGAGKSRLLGEARMGLQDRELLAVAGYAPEASVAFAAVSDLMRLLPAEATRGERLQVFEAADRWLARRGRGVVVVDDLQWVDDASRALLHYVMRGAAARRSPLALLVAARHDPACRAFAAELRTVVGATACLELDLGPLSPEETATLARALHPEVSADSDSVHAISGGWPFWVELAARRRDEREQALTRWLHEADQDGWAVLGILAVSGRPLTADLLAAVLRWPRLRVLAAVEAVRSRGLTVPEAHGERVSHDLLGDALLERHSPPELARLHTVVARHLEAVAGDDVRTLLEAVAHRSYSGEPSLALVRRILDAPGRRLLDAEDVDRLWEAVNVAPAVDASAAVLARLAALTAELGEPTTALHRWVAVAARLPDDRGRAEAWLEAARAAALAEDPETARSLLARSRAVCAPDEALRVRWDSQEAALRFLEGDLADGADLADRALRRARALVRVPGGSDGDADVDRGVVAHLHALATAADAARLVGDPAAMAEVGNEMTVIAAGRDEDARLEGLRDSGFGLLMLGRTVEAEAHLWAAYQQARAGARPLATLDGGFWLVLVLHARGRLAAAHEVVADCEELAHRLGTWSRSVENLRIASHLLALTDGDWGAAVDGLRGHADTEDDPHARIRVTYWLTSALARLTPETSAKEVADRVEAAGADARAAACRRCADELALRAADALARCGHADAAATWAARYEPDRMPSDAHLAWWSTRARASIALAAGAPEASRLLATAARRASELDLELEALWARLDLGRIAADDRAGAVHLEDARERATAIGATTEARLAAQALRARGIRAWSRTAEHAADPDVGLTAREREVAELVARGSTNREVAERLFVSPKTVESHLSHVFTKLDVRNRVELAALLHGER